MFVEELTLKLSGKVMQCFNHRFAFYFLFFFFGFSLLVTQ